MSEELTTFDEVHKEENSDRVLENVLHADDEWVINIVEDIFLKLKRIHLFIFQYDILSDTFHSVNFSSLIMLNLEDFSEGSLANNSNDFEILKFGDIVVFALMNELWSILNLLLSLRWTCHTLLNFLIFLILLLFFSINDKIFSFGVLLIPKLFLIQIEFHFFLFDLLFLCLSIILLDKVVLMVSELRWRESINSSLLVLFGSGDASEISFFNIIYVDIFIHNFLISALNYLNDYITVFTLETIIIFSWNMHGKFWLSLLVRDNVLWNTLNGFKLNLSLDFVFMNVENILSGDDKDSLLDPLILVNFLDFATEENWFSAQKWDNFRILLNFEIVVVQSKDLHLLFETWFLALHYKIKSAT